MNKKQREALAAYRETGKVSKAQYETIVSYRDALAAELDAITCVTEVLSTPCNGQAHSNAHIDHCSLCAPQWGVRPNPSKVVEVS